MMRIVSQKEIVNIIGHVPAVGEYMVYGGREYKCTHIGMFTVTLED